jgi:chromosome segregation ATPase
MRWIRFCSLMLFAFTAFAADTPVVDSPVTQALLAEIRQLRSDLQTMTAISQRVQIVMYRHQVQAGILDRVTQRLESARDSCNRTQAQQKEAAAETEQLEARRRSQNPAEQQATDQTLAGLKSQITMLAAQEQQCQAEQTEVATQVRAEQARMNEVQEQLDKLDKLFAEAWSAR